jgi:hypothetical protein
MLGGAVPAYAELITINFDDATDGTSITDRYENLGVTLSCEGSYPDFYHDASWPDPYAAYAWNDSHASSPGNIIGGKQLRYLTFGTNYGVVEFLNPVNFVSIVGTGGWFGVKAYDEEGSFLGQFSSPHLEDSESFVREVSCNGMKTIEIGAWSGYKTRFDDLRFDTSQALGLSAGNNPSMLDPIGNKTGSEGQLLEFTISATDPDAGNVLTFSASNLPDGATFDPETATFSWTPNYDQAGNYENIEFSVMDNGDPIEIDTELITITIDPLEYELNDSPLLDRTNPTDVVDGGPGARPVMKLYGLGFGPTQEGVAAVYAGSLDQYHSDTGRLQSRIRSWSNTRIKFKLITPWDSVLGQSRWVGKKRGVWVVNVQDQKTRWFRIRVLEP